jgi:hypothetical protein
VNTKRSAWIGFIFSGLGLLALPAVLAACIAPLPLPTSVFIPALPSTLIPTLASTLTPTLPATLFPTLLTTLSPALTPDEMIDRLAEPPLPANPTQLQKGAHLYWLNCAACHGDRGQGLTAEWRAVYVEDANCWARGCHAGHNGDQGFPIPRMVPVIISSSGDLLPFKTADQLFEFLRTTHPPQNPGFMPDSDYWALTAYLLDKNGRLPAEEVLGPQK